MYHFEVDSQFAAAVNPRHVAPVSGMAGYGQMSGSSSAAGSHRSTYSDTSNMGSSLSTWPSASAGYQGRDTTHDGGYASHPQLMHSQSYPPSIGYQGQHYVLSAQGVGRSNSGSSSLDQPDYDVGPSAATSAYYSEPRVAQNWADMSGTGSSLASVGRMDSSTYGVNYSY